MVKVIFTISFFLLGNREEATKVALFQLAEEIIRGYHETK